MTVDVNQMKATLQHELDALQRMGQELRVQATLASADAKDECDRLEHLLQRVQQDIQSMADHMQPQLHLMERAAHQLLAEAKQGFQRLRHTVQS
jgi:septal ring factor EnvC (AmiA/AmiB activator)